MISICYFGNRFSSKCNISIFSCTGVQNVCQWSLFRFCPAVARWVYEKRVISVVTVNGKGNFNLSQNNIGCTEEIHRIWAVLFLANKLKKSHLYIFSYFQKEVKLSL
jgi:hypothetical protein